MTYAISLSNGAALPGISALGLIDGKVDSSSTSLSLVGKNYPGYGNLINENFLHLLENFANTTAPSSALPGQIWWDSEAKVLRVNTVSSAGSAATWKTLASVAVSAPVTTGSNIGTPLNLPYTPVIGDLWWDTTSKQLKVYSSILTEGAYGWVTIGPAIVATTGLSGAVTDTITDSLSVVHTVIKFYISAGTGIADSLIAILSKSADFIPNPPIPGFSAIRQGLTLYSNMQFYGNANVAMNLMVNGSIVSANLFTRSDIVNVSAVPLLTSNNAGITLGSIGTFVANIDGAYNANLYNTTSNKDIVIYTNTGGVATPVFKANGSLGLAEVYNSPTTASGIANKIYVDTLVTNALATTLLRNGANTLTGNIIPSANVTSNLGSISSRFNLIYGVSIQALYADVAERFAADAEYLPGTVVELGGTHEITAANTELSDSVFGVVSTAPAYLMNSMAGDSKTHPPVAIGGRVPVNVIGPVKKNDRLVAAGFGLARAATVAEITPWNVIGRALENKLTNSIGTIEAIVRINT